MFTVPELMVEFSEQLWLEFDRRERSAAWPNDGEYSYNAARWNAFLNRLCLTLVVPWLEEESGLAAKVWPSEADLPGIWEVVNGTAVALDKTRFVLIPSEALDIAEFCVPQEWVDIPSWAGDYYLAVQVNPDGGWLRVWGYATHEMLKSKGIYDELERCYYLRREDAIENLNVMWVAVEVGADERVPVKPLPVLSAMSAEKLLAQLSRHSPYSPRLDVGFEQWGALLDNASWRQQLYERRMLAVAGDVAAAVAPAPASTLVNLSQWFENVVEAGWQTIEELFGAPEVNLARGFRSGGSESGSPEAIAKKIRLIYITSDEGLLKIAAQRLGEIGKGYPQAVEALIYLLGKTTDEETRWAAAESLWKIDPGNPASGVRRVKDLGMQIAGHAVALMVAALPKAEGKLAILVRVYPLGGKTSLPPGLGLTVLDEQGDIFLEVQARDTDEWIQLKLGGTRGEWFSVKVGLEGVSVSESFVI